MAIGNGAAISVSALNAQLGSNAAALRNACFEITQLWEWVLSLGANEAAQVAALNGLSGWQVPGTAAGDDPQLFWTAANNMYAVAQLYYGQLTLANAFDYDTAVAQARGIT